MFDLETLLAFMAEFKKKTGMSEKLGGLDNLSSHCHPDFRKYAKEETNSLLIYTPEDCTDLCAVTDAGLGKAIKV